MYKDDDTILDGTSSIGDTNVSTVKSKNSNNIKMKSVVIVQLLLIVMISMMKKIGS